MCLLIEYMLVELFQEFASKYNCKQIGLPFTKNIGTLDKFFKKKLQSFRLFALLKNVLFV